MGLLDEAIREHLELKRRRGADPGEVAREQHEALDPVPREAAAVGDDAVADAAADEATGLEAPLGEAPTPVSPVEAPTAPRALGGETEELDMRAVLDAQDAEAAEADRQVALHDSAGAQQVDEDPLEWEVPGERAELEHEQVDEDVLEETPDFLRDTPEQDRLWFEQRPPRDFDFDE